MNRIDRATESDVTEIMNLVKQSIDGMRSESVDQWDDIYPAEGVFREDVAKGTLFKYVVNGKIIAVICLDGSYPSEYDGIDWKDKGNRHLIVHRIVVNPSNQGQGIGRTLMNFSERVALERHCESIRLDAFVKNRRAMNLYKSLGFEIMGTVKFRKGFFACMKKIVDGVV